MGMLKFVGSWISLEKYLIRGGNPLIGEVEISGAKNAVVAILSATLLANAHARYLSLQPTAP